MDEAERTVQQLLDKLQNDPKLKADAAKGFIRAPQLALVELQLRKLDASHPHQRPTLGHQTAVNGQQWAESQVQTNAHQAAANGQQQAEPERHANDHQAAANGQQQAEPKRQANGINGDASRSLAEAVWSYYKQLGHMLSCAIDLR